MSRIQQLYDRRADYLPTTLFAAFSVTGTVYIILSKLFQFPAWLVTSFPVGLMMLYAVAILLFRRARLRDDQIGDNFYYMGFIFTLTSLAVSLSQYSQGSSVDQIVQNFGIAVSTTIAGIVFRIIFNMSRRDPVEVEHLSRMELSEASNRVRRELNASLVDFAHFRRSNQQMLEEGYGEIAQRFEKTANTALASIEQVAKSAEKSVQNSSQYEARELIAEEILRTQALLTSINDNLSIVDEQSERIAAQLKQRLDRKPLMLRIYNWVRRK